MLCKEPTGPKGNYALSPSQLLSIKEYIPCLNSDLWGDRNNVLEQIFEGIQLNEGTVGPTPEQLVISTPDEGPKPEEIQSEVQGNEVKGNKDHLASYSHLALAPNWESITPPALELHLVLEG